VASHRLVPQAAVVLAAGPALQQHAAAPVEHERVHGADRRAGGLRFASRAVADDGAGGVVEVEELLGYRASLRAASERT
jgi:hypothetical protein